MEALDRRDCSGVKAAGAITMFVEFLKLED